MIPSESEASLIARWHELPEDEQAEFLRHAAANHPELRERLQQTPSTRSPPLPISDRERAHALALALDTPEASSTTIGPYRLLQKIGEGGFGEVWMAEQQEPIRRRVALKIIKSGMDTREVIARFEAERQALAIMDHPHIARVFDAGETDTGRPYFVMELVRGIAITRYCDENRLPAKARLRLFISVCHAVQHAHQKGVIHRDLKPSNILVTLHDGVPVPKVIDFGIAKATSAHLTDRTLFTQFHAFIGTPAYTSPEQMEMSGLDVDTRTDIYSLGVLLYEMLTGRPPFDPEALAKSGLEAMRRTIREVDPPRPSTRLSTLTEGDRTAVAMQRSTDAAKLSVLLRGDLDWVVMRSLEKDRTRRYETAAALAEDLERHLATEPVAARPPSGAYRLHKFIRRHKVGFVAAAAVAVSLVAGLITASVSLVRERAARARAVVAERAEGELRQQAETARTDEVKRAARTALDLANRHLADGKFADGLAYLVYAARKDPQNVALAPRLVSALTSTNFMLPVGASFACGSRVLAVRFSKDGRTIFVGTEDGTFRVLDAVSGALRREFRLGREVIVGGWEFASENERVLGVRFADNTFTVLDASSGQPRWSVVLDATVRTYNERAGLNHSPGLSPDGRWAHACAVRQFWLWDARTGAVVLNPTFPENAGAGVDLRPDGGELALFAGESVRRWTLPEGRPVDAPIVVERPANVPVSSIAWTVRYSRDGRRLVVTHPLQGVQLFDTNTGERLRTLPPWDELVAPESVAFDTKDRLFAAGVRSTGWWNLHTGEFTKLPLPPPHFVHPFTFDASGSRVLSASPDGFARVCDLPGGTPAVELTWQQPLDFNAALSPDGTQLVIGTTSGLVHRLRLGSGRAQPLALPRAASPLMPAIFLPEPGPRLLWLTGDRARVLEVASGREVTGGFTYPEPVLQPERFEWNPPMRPDGKFMVMRTKRGQMQSWALGPGGVTQIAVLESAPVDAYRALVFSARGDRVALLNRDQTRLGVWDLHTGAPAGPLYVEPVRIPGLTPNLSPDGTRIAFTASDGPAMVIDVATARPLTSFNTRPLVSNLSAWFSPDGTRILTANFLNEARLWNADTGEPISPVIRTKGESGASRFSPDGRRFVTWGVNLSQFWDGATGAPVGEEIPAGGKVVRFSPDGRSLTTCGTEGKAQVWDVLTGQALTEPMHHVPQFIVNPEFSPDGRFLRTEKGTDVLTKSGEANFYLWSVPPRLPDGAVIPEWLLQLATVAASKVVNDAGQLADVTEAFIQLEAVRRELATLPADAPYADWGRWVLDDRANRPIAPGFTITPAEAAKLAADMMTAMATP